MRQAPTKRRLAPQSRLRWPSGSAASVLLAAVLVVVMAPLVAISLGAPPASATARAPQGVDVLPDMPVTPQDLKAHPSSNSPELASDPGNPSFVALASRLEDPRYGCSLEVSVDGGRLWAPASPVPTLPAGATSCYAPQVAFGPGGELFYLFLGLSGAANSPMGAFLVTSTDYAKHFSAPRRVLGPGNYMVSMAIDDRAGGHGRIHLAWVNTSASPTTDGFQPTDNPILADYSDDGGKTFSQPVRVSDPARQRVVAPALVLGPNHSVTVAYYDLGADARDYEGLQGPTWSGKWSLVVATSHDAGRSFTTGSVVDDQVTPSSRVMLIFSMAPPAIAVDHRGRVFVAWSDARYGSADVVLRRSTNGGRTWGPLVRINHDQAADASMQYLPHLSVAPDGRVDATWLDRRGEVNDTYNNTYYASSTNGGLSFGPNVRLSSMSSNSRKGPTYPVPSAKGLVDFGSGLALVSLDSVVLAAWPDTSSSLGPRQQDIYSTEVNLPGSGGLSSGAWALLAGVIAIVVVGGIGLFLWRQQRAGRPGRVPREKGSVLRGRRLPPLAGGVLVVALGAGLSATFLTGASITTPVPVGVVKLTMRDYSYIYHKPASSGMVVFEVHNASNQPHDLNLEELPPHFPITIEQQLKGKVRRAFPAFGRLPPLGPGRSATFAVDLGPGLYAMVGFTKGPSGVIDGVKGMASEFRISQS
ncbi:MAG: sialidase family protein [Acidimicrobiales bacterium]